MTCFGLIRHAQTTWNLEKKIQGQRDIPLSEDGKVQAGKWAFNLQSLCFDRILASPMLRAKQTSGIIARHTGLSIDFEAGLQEQDFGDWEGKTIKFLRHEQPGIIEAQENRGWDFTPPGGESRRMVLDRSLAVIERAARNHPGKRILAVTHNAVMKCLIYHAAGRSFDPAGPPLLLPYHLHWLNVEVNPATGEAGLLKAHFFNDLDLEKDPDKKELFKQVPKEPR